MIVASRAAKRAAGIRDWNELNKPVEQPMFGGEIVGQRMRKEFRRTEAKRQFAEILDGVFGKPND